MEKWLRTCSYRLEEAVEKKEPGFYWLAFYQSTSKAYLNHMSVSENTEKVCSLILIFAAGNYNSRPPETEAFLWGNDQTVSIL
jgi:hypothetical protein